MDLAFKTIPFWALWANPIFRRYCRSRLRLKILLPWSIITLIFTSFIFLLPYTIVLFAVPGEERHLYAAQAAVVPLLAVQAILLLLKGTFSSAAGIVRESDEKMTDYQRLTPMSPLAKIVGYLFGLPVMEYVLFLLTVPFTVYAVLVGRIPGSAVVQVYSVFFCTVILYHLTGVVAGTVVRNKVFAGLLSQVLVISIFFILPQLSKIGYVIFEYLTPLPVLVEQSLRVVPKDAFQGSDGGMLLQWLRSIMPSVQFFNLNFSQLESSLIIQGALMIVFVVILYRKWVQPAKHLLGKHFSLAVMGGIMTLVLGNALPLIESGEILLSRTTRLGQRVSSLPMRDVTVEEGVFMAGFFGFVSLVIVLVLIQIITPTRDEFRKGLRRARKAGKKRSHPGADEATSFWHAIILALLGIATWTIFTRALFQSEIYRNHDIHLPLTLWIALPFSILLPAICVQCFLEIFGRASLILFVIIVWIVPCMASIILMIASRADLAESCIYLLSLSSLITPFYCIATVVGDIQPPPNVDLGHLHKAFWISLLLYLGAALFFSMKLREHHAKIEEEA